MASNPVNTLLCGFSVLPFAAGKRFSMPSRTNASGRYSDRTSPVLEPFSLVESVEQANRFIGFEKRHGECRTVGLPSPRCT